jgi:hypothetical protein
LNIVARSQRGKGLFKNKAPHAHLIEYGWVPKGGRPRKASAIESIFGRNAGRVTEEIRRTMELYVDRLRFPQ